MLQLKDIKKDYTVGEQTVSALKGVSISFRESEFVSILGQSGCGKTTLMNIIGGLDRATSGELLIDGISTNNFSATDWDEYRNEKIGFVFQSYNLISHLSVLDNVELALTISGISGSAKTERAKAALERVGLGTQLHKLPSQLSGGQMQRVAIARAIVNKPAILLADEPTGAIDSETSVQIMDILKELANDRLVIMVTHNNELAEKYSTRIINILDGRITADNNPVLAESESQSQSSLDADAADMAQLNAHSMGEDVSKAQNTESALPNANKKRGKRRKSKKSSMSFFTAVKLSAKNLIAKRGRSLMTVLAGSITVISIALILAVNNGFGIYIKDFEEMSMSKYPIVVSSGESSMLSMFEEFVGGDDLKGDSISFSSIFDILSGNSSDKDKFTNEQLIYIYGQFSGMLHSIMNDTSKDLDLTKFKKHIEENFDKSLGTVKYDYSINLNVYKKSVNTENAVTYSQINPLSKNVFLAPLLKLIMGNSGSEASQATMLSMLDKYAFFDELIADDSMIMSQYDVLAGTLPKNKNEIVLVIDSYNQISDFDAVLMNELGFADLLVAANNPQNLDDFTKEFDKALEYEFCVLPTGSSYVYNDGTKLYDDVNGMGTQLLNEYLSKNGLNVKLSGILRPKEGVDGCIKGIFGYPSSLGDYIIDEANNCDYIRAQIASYENYIDLQAQAYEIYASLEEGQSIRDLPLEKQMILTKAATTKITDVRTGEEITASDHNSILTNMNVRNLDKPNYIYIYPSSVPNKAKIVSFINDFNAVCSAEEAQADLDAKEAGEQPPTITSVVKYSDDLDSVVNEMNSVVNTITYILIAVALVAVIVTMLLIAIIMYISVQDRTREIGILRSLGARKLDISNIFNVETMLIGALSSVIGMILAAILQFPLNSIFAATLDISSLLKIAWWHPLVVIVGAIAIIVLSGVIPSMLAAKKDPVIALRSE
ncbi:MAG: ATP-binding cassette domain-containing protein [Clostridiales bacterium]|nr:ATP-binding cassette domain-containing protein [Clostridiales bacterium]